MTNTRYTKEKIYDLLPSIYRIRDNEQSVPDKEGKKTGGPLKALLELIGEQVELVEEDIERLYDNWFIETCAEWLVQYIGDLLNTRIVNPVTSSTSGHRSLVANTISYRRRKGTLGTVEQLSRDVTGWNCRAVEFFENLITNQNLNHLRMKKFATIDLRDKDMLELIGTPFDRSAHSVDVRHIDSKRGYYNISNIGIFLWRLQAYPVVNAAALSLGEGRFTFSQLGYDLALYNHPETETSIDHMTTEVNVPTKIRRTALKTALENHSYSNSSFQYEHSIRIVKSSLENGQILESQILPRDMEVCNLSNWHHPSQPNKEKEVAIDPELGRLIFSDPEKKIVNVHVSYYYGFSGDIGGGFYDRKELGGEAGSIVVNDEDSYHYKIAKKNPENPFISLSKALEKWEKDQHQYSKKGAIFEVADSEIYADESNDGPLKIEIPENVTLIIRSENKERPVFRLKHAITVKGEKGSGIVFDGILFTLSDNNDNNTILKILKGDLSKLVINHCTFVPQEDSIGRLLFSWKNMPGTEKDVLRLKYYLFHLLNEKWLLGDDAILKKEQPDSKRMIISLTSTSTTSASVMLEVNSGSNTISIKKRVGEDDYDEGYQTIYNLPTLKNKRGSKKSLKVYRSRYSLGIFGHNIDGTTVQNNDNLKILINRSIMGRVDSLSSGASLKIVDSIIDGKGEIEAIRCTSANIENTTIFGKVSSLILEMASNSIFTDTVNTERRQRGCIRFCYIPTGSQIPRTYRCIFESSSENRVNTFITNGGMRGSVSALNNPPAHSRIRPQFSSTRYGDEGYGQLHRDVDQKIFEGGDNGSEMGAFNHLYNPQRIKNLLFSLDEYLKFGLEAGIFLVT